MPYTEFLYHFTDKRNIESIKEHGLYSFAALKKRLEYTVESDFYPSSNDRSRTIDFNKGLSNYIRLCGDQYHPMVNIALSENRIKEVTWLRMNFPDIVFRHKDVKFSDMNAASNNATVNTEHATFTQSFDNQREVLVRFHIPFSKIEIIN